MGLASRPRSTGRAAATALVLAAAAAVAVVSLAPAPATWHSADPLSGEGWSGSPWAPTLTLLSGALPVFSGASRPELLVRLLMVATATAAAWACLQLFRGPGRTVAALTASPLTAWSLLELHGAPGQLLPSLSFSLLMTLAVGSQLRALVHFGTVTAVARARSLVAAGVATTFDPIAGAPIYLLLLAVSVLRARRLRPHTSTGRPWARPRVLPVGMGVAVPALVWTVGLATAQLATPELPRLSLEWPGPGWSATIPTALAYPALALVGVLVAPLRWRGGWTLSAMVIGAFVLHGDGELLAPAAARVVMLVTAGSGWIWLAGSFLPPRPLTARALSLAAAAAVAGLRLATDPSPLPWPVQAPASRDRPDRSLVAAYTRGLVAPGDVLLVTQPWLHRELTARQRDGFRPDVELVDLSLFPNRELALAAMGWAADRRRVLSDSFSVGGRWDPAWAADAGTLFWFVGEAASGAQLLDLGELVPLAADRMDPALAHRWARLFVERARFRRIHARGEAALQALPLEDRLALADEIRRSTLRRAPVHGETELRAPPADTPAGALVRAEAGDLLLASGATSGPQLLAEAGEEGLPTAWGALARWQLRAGSSHAASETLARLAGDDRLREPALDVLEWLVHRERLDEARQLRDRLAPSARLVEREVAARLGLLTAQAGRLPAPPTGRSEPP